MIDDALVYKISGATPDTQCIEYRLKRTVIRNTLAYIANNPIGPTTRDDCQNLYGVWLRSKRGSGANDLADVVAEWQRRMFLKPKPHIEPCLVAYYANKGIDLKDVSEAELKNAIALVELGKQIGAKP